MLTLSIYLSVYRFCSGHGYPIGCLDGLLVIRVSSQIAKKTGRRMVKAREKSLQ